MTIAELSGITSQYFPSNLGILLIGNQREKEIFSSGEEIELVLLDPQLSHVREIVFSHNNFRLKINAIPVTDIENVLENESNDFRGGILAKLVCGITLKDNLNLFPSIREKARVLGKTLSSHDFTTFHFYYNFLSKSLSYLDRRLSKEQKTILLCDIVSQLSEIENLKYADGGLNEFKYSMCDDERSRELCNNLIVAFNQSLQFDNNEPITTLINYYLQTAKNTVSYMLSSSTRLLYNLEYADFSIVSFTTSILPCIKNEEILRDNFRNFYVSPSQYYKRYKSNVILVFQIASHAEAAQVIKEMDYIFEKKIGKNKKYALIYQNNDAKSADYLKLFEELRSAINSFLCDEIQHERYAPILQIYHAVAIGGYVSNYFPDLSAREIAKASGFLAQRSTLSLQEQYELNGNDQLRRALAIKFQNFQSFYQQHSKGLLDFCNKGILMHLQQNIEEGGVYMEIQTAINNILNEEKCFENYSSNLNFGALKYAHQEEGLISMFKYITVMEEVLKYLGINEQEKFLVLLSLSRSLSELKGQNSLVNKL